MPLLLGAVAVLYPFPLLNMTAESWLVIGLVHASLLLLHDVIVFVAHKASGRMTHLLAAFWRAYRASSKPVRVPIRYETPGRLYDLGVIFVLCGLGIANLFV